jgi:hypothetical protein
MRDGVGFKAVVGRRWEERKGKEECWCRIG